MKNINLRQASLVQQDVYVKESFEIYPPAWAFAGLFALLVFYGFMFLGVVL